MAGVQIGLRDLYYAINTKDDATGTAYQTPVLIAGAIDAKVSPKSNNATLYADDGPAETATALGEITVDLEAKDLPLEAQAALLGHTIVGGVMVKKSTDMAPYVAIGFRSLKSNGKFRYVWLLKGKFDAQETEYKTQEDKPAFQTAKLSGIFVRRDYDKAWQRITDEDHPDYVPSIGTNWFTSPDGTVDTTAPTVTIAPANNASAVPVTSVVTWTFNEAIQASTMTADNFFVIKDTDGSLVAGTMSINVGRTVVTFTPSANLTAATAYRTVVTSEVCDLAGNKVATTVTKFTTA